MALKPARVSESDLHDLRSEQAVLGAVLNTAWAWSREREWADPALAMLEPRDFYRYAHESIWDAMQAVVKDGNPPNMIFVCDQLQRSGLTQQAIGPAYLQELEAANWPERYYIANHARVVRSAALQRRLADAASSGDPDGIAEANQGLAALGAVDNADDYPTMREAMDAYFDAMGDDSTTAVRTGIGSLDRLTGGFRPGNLIVIAARPGEGKTALGLTIGQHTAIRSGVPIGFLSLEMSTPEIIQRLIAMEATISTQEARQISERTINAQGRIAETPFYIRHPGASLADVLAAAGPLVTRQGCKLIVVDYLQLMSGDARTDNRSLDIASVTRGLKSFAQAQQVPVIVLAQLNRESEKHSGPPRISDIADSDAPGRDADIVLLLDRESKDGPRYDTEAMKLIVAKHRNGPTAAYPIQFVRKTTRFVETEWSS